MSLLYYFGPPVIFILSCMVFLRLSGVKSKRLHRMTRSAGLWLGSWSLIGFAVAFGLGIAAWILNNDFVMGHADWVWPFCIAMMALAGNPTTLEILLILAIAAVENAILYFLLAAVVELGSHLIAKVRGPRNESPSIMGR